MTWTFDAGGGDGVNATRNLAKVDGHRHGVVFLPVKALLASVGWTVEGSGDGASLHEFRGTTAGAGTGSGGAFDVWTVDNQSDDGAAGNVSNALTWSVLKAPTGTMEILLVGTSQTSSGWDAYGSICFSHSAGYAAAGVGPTTPPGAPADEQILIGARPFGSGAVLVDYPGAQWVHVAANDAAVNGIYGFYYCTVDTSGVRKQMLQLVPLLATRPWDVAPYAFLTAATGQTIHEWEKKGLTGERFYVNTSWMGQILFNQAFWNGLGYDDPETGDLPMGEPQIIAMKSQANQEYFRGVMPDVRIRAAASDGAAVSADYPSLTERDPDGVTWLHWDDQALPWDVSASPPTPSGGTGGTTAVDWFRMEDLAPTPPPAEYLQRIYDTGLGAYCYYKRSSTDPTSPAIGVGDTQPVNTGALVVASNAVIGSG